MVLFKAPQLEGECVFHYTSSDALLNILQDGKIVLWLTHADYLNDSTEGIGILNYIEPVCKKLFSRGEISQKQYQEIMSIQIENIQDFPTMLIPESNIPCSVDYKACDVYTMSFSSDSDSLPMWNYYANKGYCLHFNKEYLKSIFPKQFECFCDVRPIKYTSDIVSDLEEAFHKFAQEQDATRVIQDYLATERYFYKNEAFAYEKEYRLLLAVPKDQKQTFKTEFREKDGYIIPYIQIELTNWQQLFGMVKGVTVGPLANRELSQKGIVSLLETREYFVAAKNVKNSTIPVRY